MATEAECKQAGREYEFITQVLMARDMLEPIITGEIVRGHCIGNRTAYGAVPGKRKTKLTDAVQIAKTVKVILDRAVNKFDRGD